MFRDRDEKPYPVQQHAPSTVHIREYLSLPGRGGGLSPNSLNCSTIFIDESTM